MADLIIGGAGFLASELARQLNAGGHSILGAIHHQGVKEPELWAGVMSVNDAIDAIAHLPSLECVYLLASAIPYAAMDTMTQELQEANVELPRQVAVSLAKRVETGLGNVRLVFASSTSVYGKVPASLPITEETELAVATAYGQSKREGELAAHRYPNTVTLRFSSLYGPGMVASTFLPRLVAQAKTAPALSIYGTGGRKQDYLHVTDAAGMLIAAASSKSGIYLGVNGNASTNLEVAQLISQLAGGLPIIHTGVDNSPSWEYDAEHSHNAMQYSPSKSLLEGLKTLF